MADRDMTVVSEGVAGLGRLIRIALRDTGQSRRVADFLMAWHHARENGGWDPTDLWSIDSAIAEDILAAINLLRDVHRYPGDLGFQREIQQIWELWRLPTAAEGR
jgi:ParB family chromosome partitioning protein